MIKKIVSIAGLGVLGVVLLAGVAFAQSGPQGASSTTASSIPYWGPLVSCVGGTSDTFPTCKDLCDTFATINNIIYFVITLALFAGAPIMLLWGGALMLLAGANEAWYKQGQDMLKNTVIGIAIILVSYILVRSFVSLLGLTQYIKGFDGNSSLECTISGGAVQIGGESGSGAGGGGQ